MGYSAERDVTDVTFDNVSVNGEKVTSLKDFVTNSFISDIKFK